MREIVIVISDLYLSQQARIFGESLELRLPALARIARFASTQELAEGWRPWLARWTGRAELATTPVASVAAAGIAALALAPNDMVWLATPVHLRAGLSDVYLDPQGLLRLDAATQSELQRSFASVFGASGYHLTPLASGGFLAAGPWLHAGGTTDPASRLGASIAAALPAGEDAAQLRRLSAEIEMWLHDHPVNIAREQRQQQPISALWLWGGGREIARATDVPRVRRGFPEALSEDAYVQGLWRASGADSRPLPGAFGEVLDLKADRAVLTLEVFRPSQEPDLGAPAQALERLDREWIMPALRAVDRGEVARLTIIANNRQLSLQRRDRLRLWRRSRGALAGLR